MNFGLLMRRRVIIFLLVYFFTNSLAFSRINKDIDIICELNTEFGLQYKSNEKSYNLQMPLWGKMGLMYKGKGVESLISLRYTDEPVIGETYIIGGDGYSYIKVGNFVEEWGVGYSIRPAAILNVKDNFFPDSIFYRRFYKPNPIFKMTMGNEKLYSDLIVSNIKETISSVNDSLFGLRTVWKQSEYDFSMGFMRDIGYPPPLYFLTMQRNSLNYRVWLELDWEYHLEDKDVWSAVLGVNKSINSSKTFLEYVIDRSNSFLWLLEIITVNPVIESSIKCFLHVPSFSFALNIFFNYKIDRYILFEPGAYLFLGKSGDYFSNAREGNDNAIYIRLKRSF